MGSLACKIRASVRTVAAKSDAVEPSPWKMRKMRKTITTNHIDVLMQQLLVS